MSSQPVAAQSCREDGAKKGDSTKKCGVCLTSCNGRDAFLLGCSHLFCKDCLCKSDFANGCVVCLKSGVRQAPSEFQIVQRTLSKPQQVSPPFPPRIVRPPNLPLPPPVPLQFWRPPYLYSSYPAGAMVSPHYWWWWRERISLPRMAAACSSAFEPRRNWTGASKHQSCLGASTVHHGGQGIWQR